MPFLSNKHIISPHILFQYFNVLTLLTLLRILFLGRIGSISYVLPIRQNIDILNRNIRVCMISIQERFLIKRGL